MMQKCHLRYARNVLRILMMILCVHMILTPDASSFETVKRPSMPFNLRVMFDLKGDDSIIWDGTARVTEGVIDEIKGIGFEHDDKIYSQSHSWRCILTKKPCGPCGEVVTSKGLMFHVTSPLNATVILATKAGNFCIPLYELSLGKTIERYEGRLQIALAPRDFLISSNRAQDDSPDIEQDKSGRMWTCWISHEKGKDHIVARHFLRGEWSRETRVSTKPGIFHKPVLAKDGKEGIWIAWSAYQNGNWDVYARHYNGSKWGRVKRLTRDTSNDVNQTLATDPFGNTWLCWEGYQNGNADIYMKYQSNQKWSETIQITKDEANDRQPDLAIDHLGKVYVSWTRFSKGQYYILLRDIKSSLGNDIPIAVSKHPLAHPSMACIQENVWIAWDEVRNVRKQSVDPKNVFYALREIGVRCYRNGSLYDPTTDMYDGFPFPLMQHAELPELSVDQNGKLWVFFSNYVMSLPHNIWRIYGVYYQGDEWSQPILFPHYTWKNVASVSSCCDDSGDVWMTWGSDNRDMGNSFLSDRDIYVGYLNQNSDIKRSLHITPYTNQKYDLNALNPEVQEESPTQWMPEDQDQQLVWGTLYQPNNVKGYTGLDGFVTDIYRAVMDDADLDFLSVGHFLSYDNKAYTSWLAHKANCLFSESKQFISVFIPEEIQHQIYKSFNDMALEKESAFLGTFVDDLSSESLNDALESKRVYIASDKIFLDAKILGHRMGDAFKTKATTPTIDIRVIGTDTLYQVDIFRNDACIYSRFPKGRSVKFSFLDLKMPKGRNHYSVQVVQKNGDEARTLTSILDVI